MRLPKPRQTLFIPVYFEGDSFQVYLQQIGGKIEATNILSQINGEALREYILLEKLPQVRVFGDGRILECHYAASRRARRCVPLPLVKCGQLVMQICLLEGICTNTSAELGRVFFPRMYMVSPPL
jgi:hypothetical protein